MKSFKTENNTYYINETVKMLSGGILESEVKKYVVGHVVQGNPAYFEFEDGTTLTTSTVMGID